jgi:RsiW-degrading membrane proteinase PrsW (M82 family)
VSTALGLVLLLVGGLAALGMARHRADLPPAGWHPDPFVTLPRDRCWDGQTWTAATRPGPTQARRGRRFRGRFWSMRWVGPALAAVAVVAIGSATWLRTHSVPVLVALSAVGMALVCLAFYRFVERQLDLAEVIGLREVVAIAVATAGVVLLVALRLNNAIVTHFGLTVALGAVGPVEEGTKLLVPLVLYFAGCYRNARAGVAAGLAAGFGFAVTETSRYAVTLPLGGAPDPCTGATLPALGPEEALVGQVLRIALVSPLHWLWTGIALTVIWRQWRLSGVRLTGPVLAAVVFVMATHSLVDSSAVWTCDAPPAGLLLKVAASWLSPFVLYLVFRFVARRSLPPQLVGSVSRGWHPR